MLENSQSEVLVKKINVGLTPESYMTSSFVHLDLGSSIIAEVMFFAVKFDYKQLGINRTTRREMHFLPLC